MNKLSSTLLGLAALFVAPYVAAAQEVQPPPKVLVIIREFLKPGKAGAVHEKAEAAFVQAFAKAKSNSHYLAMNSMTGKPRSLFLSGYDSFESWEKDGKAVEKNASLSSALDRASVADGDLLDSSDQAAFSYREDFSFHAPVEIAKMRYFEIAVFRVKPGREAEWNEGTKLVMAASQKSTPDAHWACYESFYGAPGNTFLFITPYKSAAEVDQSILKNKGFAEAMGESGMKKLSELSAASIESMETNLFAFSPRMSYVPDEWIKLDPDYWKPKAAVVTAKATEKDKAAQ
jgi:hypothetical protein